MCSEKLSGAAMENTLLRCLHSDPERKCQTCSVPTDRPHLALSPASVSLNSSSSQFLGVLLFKDRLGACYALSY